MDKPSNKTNNQLRLLVGYLMAISILFGIFLAIANFVDGGKVSGFEKSVFIAINGMPELLKYPMIGFQYLGLLIVPAAAAIVALIYRKYLLAVLFLLIIPAKIYAEKLIKANFHRERPKVYIPEAILRGDVQASGLSFTSGHAIIIFAIVTFATPFVPKLARFILWGLALLCIFARVYLGAHLPLDVIGGALVGMIIGLLFLTLFTLAQIVFSQIRRNKTSDVSADS